MRYIIYILIAFCALYLYSIRGRRGNPALTQLREWKYAHRGLHDDKLPENSMGAFRAALENGYGIELDVHLLADGNLAVIHDSPLKRTTGAEGIIEDLTTEDLTRYNLEGTDETIPTFQEVLDLYEGKAPLIVELKPVKGNHAALTAKTVEMLDKWNGLYCLESFDPRCVYWLKKNRPEICRGQLAGNYFEFKEKLSVWLRIVLTWHMENFLCLPDFTAYRFCDRKNPGTWLVRKVWGVQGVSWTLTTPEEYATAVKEGWIPIFENFKP